MGSAKKPGKQWVTTLVVALVVCIVVASSAIVLWYPRDTKYWTAEATFRIGFLDTIDSLNPYIGLNKASAIFDSLVYDPLVAIDEDLNETPDLAESWYPVPLSDMKMVSSGEPFGSVWQYNLTRGAFWHDGEPFTANDVIFNIQLNAWNYTTMWGFQPSSFFMNWAEKIDEYTVRIHFFDRDTSEPIPVAFGSLTKIPMLPEHRLREMSASDISFEWQGCFDNEDIPIVGTGPFIASNTTYEDWYNDDTITLIRNPNYNWRLDPDGEDGEFLTTQINKVELMWFDEVTAMKLALRAHVIDLAEFPEDVYVSMKENISAGTVSDVECYDGLSPSQNLVYLSWLLRNTTDNPSILDPTIRGALSNALNRSEIVGDFFSGMAMEATTVISPLDSVWHYEPTAFERFDYDLSAANASLETAGYIDNDGDGIRECTNESYAVTQGLVPAGTPLFYTIGAFSLGRLPMQSSLQIAHYLQSEWRKVGVNSSITGWTNMTRESMCPFELADVAVIEWIPFEPDPNTMLFSQSKRAWYGWSDTFYFNADYEDHYNKSVSAMDPAQRRAEVFECQRLHYLDNAYTNLVYGFQLYCWNTRDLEGWGDWGEHPGMSLDNVFGPCPLLFSLKPARVHV